MRNIFNYIVAFSLLLISCDENPIMQSTLPVEFTTDALMKYEVPADPGVGFSINFTVEDPYYCSIESDQEWCKVKTTCNNGIYVSLNVEKNLTGMLRTAKVTISSPKIKGDYVIEVAQSASVFDLTNLKREYAPEGGEYKLYVSSDSPWTLESEGDWLVFDKTSGEATVATGAVEVNLMVKPNDTGILRNKNVTLRSSSGSEIVTEVFQSEPWITDVRVGDGGLRFDDSKIDPVYASQIQEWMKAGVKGGIPLLKSQLAKIDKTFEPGTTTAAELNAWLNTGNKYEPRIIFLKNGEYTFSESIRLYSQDVLIGESRDGVVIKTIGGGSASISLYAAGNAGIRNLTIKGKWSENDPNPMEMENILPNRKGNTAVYMAGAENCYVDNVKIINSASHPIYLKNSSVNGIMKGGYNTIRDIEIDGAYNKGGDCNGYVYIGNSHNLITGCKVIHIRHISFQEEPCANNVFYKNEVAQEISFHNSDGGNNLIENNRITIPETLKGYCSIMGPWSDQHKVGGKNFVYRNKCLEVNNNNKTPWSDNELYIGPWEVKPADLYTQFRIIDGYPKPVGKTLYPIILKK